MKPVVFHGAAEAEFRRAVAWYESQRAGLGRDLRTEVEAAILRVRQRPEAFERVPRQATQRCRVERFPYTIYYVELGDAIWIAAVAHHRRRPDYWKRRKPM